jgi:hypothetical protein
VIDQFRHCHKSALSDSQNSVLKFPRLAVLLEQPSRDVGAKLRSNGGLVLFLLPGHVYALAE